MLVIDPSNEPGEDYAPMNEMDGMFAQNRGGHFHGQNNKNLVPRDVIVEEENERTQDSALLRITEEREETKQGQSQKDLNSEASPPQKQHTNEEDEHNGDNYEEDYEDEPVPTKPFENKSVEEASANQEDLLKMINNPADRPTTRNPRMQRSEARSKKHESKGHESGEFDKRPQDVESLKIQKEIGGHSNFELPEDDE